MELRPIKNRKQYQLYMDWVDKQLDKNLSPNTVAGNKLQIVLILIKHYEDVKFPIPKPDPIAAIKSMMLEKGLKSKDLVGKIGSKGHVSAILKGKKPLTLHTARILHKELGIPAEVFLNVP